MARKQRRIYNVTGWTVTSSSGEWCVYIKEHISTENIFNIQDNNYSTTLCVYSNKSI